MKFLAFATAALVGAASMTVTAAPAEARHGGWHNKKVCRTVMRHGHRSRVCRTVRHRW